MGFNMLNLKSTYNAIQSLATCNNYEKFFIQDTISLVNLLDRQSLRVIQNLRVNERDVLSNIEDIFKKTKNKDFGFKDLDYYNKKHVARLNKINEDYTYYNTSYGDILFKNLDTRQRYASNTCSFSNAFSLSFGFIATLVGILFPDIDGISERTKNGVKICICLLAFCFSALGYFYGWYANSSRLSYNDLARHIKILIDIVDKRVKLIDDIFCIQAALNDNETMITYVESKAVKNSDYQNVAVFFKEIKHLINYERIRLPELSNTNFCDRCRTLYSDLQIPWSNAGEIDSVYELYMNKQLRGYETLRTPREDLSQNLRVWRGISRRRYN